MRELRKDSAFISAERDAEKATVRAERRASGRAGLAFMQASRICMRSFNLVCTPLQFFWGLCMAPALAAAARGAILHINVARRAAPHARQPLCHGSSYVP